MKIENLSEAEPWRAGGPPPPGNHIARIDEAKESESRNGYPQLELVWTVVGGEYDGAECRDWLTITEATRGKVVALLQATGIEITPGDFELNAADLVNRRALIVLRREPKYGEPEKMVTKVAGYKAAPDESSNGASGSTGEKPLPF